MKKSKKLFLFAVLGLLVANVIMWGFYGFKYFNFYEPVMSEYTAPQEHEDEYQQAVYEGLLKYYESEDYDESGYTKVFHAVLLNNPDYLDPFVDYYKKYEDVFDAHHSSMTMNDFDEIFSKYSIAIVLPSVSPTRDLFNELIHEGSMLERLLEKNVLFLFYSMIILNVLIFFAFSGMLPKKRKIFLVFYSVLSILLFVAGLQGTSMIHGDIFFGLFLTAPYWLFALPFHLLFWKDSKNVFLKNLLRLVMTLYVIVFLLTGLVGLWVIGMSVA